MDKTILANPEFIWWAIFYLKAITVITVGTTAVTGISLLVKVTGR